MANTQGIYAFCESPVLTNLGDNLRSYTIVGVIPPSTRNAAPLVAAASGLAT